MKSIPMKCFKLCTLAILVLLSSCESIFELESHPLEFNSEEYISVDNWEMIEYDNYVKDKATWAQKEYEVYVYEDLQKRFIYEVYYQTLYHKKTDVLPNFQNLESIEKMVIVYSDVNKSNVDLDNETILKTAVELMSQPYDRDVFKNNSPFKKTVASIKIYFKDYPAIHSAVSVIKTWDGTLGFRMFDWTFTENVRYRDYIVVPSNSQMQYYFK